MRLRVLYHGNCFDGCSSAGVFTRFYRERVAKAPVEVAYRPLEHKGAAVPLLTWLSTQPVVDLAIGTEDLRSLYDRYHGPRAESADDLEQEESS